MKRIAKDVELLGVTDIGDWMQVRAAVNGSLCFPFEVHKSEWNERPEADLEALLARQARTMCEVYGDVRYAPSGAAA